MVKNPTITTRQDVVCFMIYVFNLKSRHILELINYLISQDYPGDTHFFRNTEHVISHDNLVGRVVHNKGYHVVTVIPRKLMILTRVFLATNQITLNRSYRSYDLKTILVSDIHPKRVFT